MTKLYSYFRSSSSYRVRIALNLKGLDYEIVPIHLLKDGGQQFTEKFSSLNRAHKVPTLEHDGNVLAQSVAIIEYLDEVFQRTPLYPADPLQKALCRQMIEIINSDIQPLQNLSVLKKLVGQHGFSEEQKVSWIQHWIDLGFESYEALAKKTAGNFSFGDTPTAADCFLIPQIFNALRFEMEMAKYPTLLKIHNNAIKHPAFEKAHPNNQPDTPS